MSSLRDTLAIWRNRLLQQPQFLSFAQNMPILRGVAQRRALELFRLVAGFVNSQVLLSCIELRLLDLLAEAPRSESEVAAASGLPPERAQLLLRAAESLGIFERDSIGRYRLGALGASLQADAGLLALISHHRHFYQDLADPVSLLRNTNGVSTLGQLWPYAGNETPRNIDHEAVSAYTDVMAASQRMIAEQVLRAARIRRFHTLLDVGGGDGSFLNAVAARHPHLQLGLFDLPAVVGIAEQRLKAAGLDRRVHLYAGDFHRDELPAGYELITLIRILHDHDDLPALNLLKAARRALAPGGTLLIAEPLRATRGAEEMGAAYFGFYLLAMGSGGPRNFAELQVLLKSAGFRHIRRHRTSIPLICSVITAS